MSIKDAISVKYVRATPIHVTNVIYNNPATVILWSDGSRTVVRCQLGDTYDPKTGFLLALVKKSFGNTSSYNQLLKQWIPGYGKEASDHE